MSDSSREPRPYGAPGEPPLRRPWHPPPGGRGDLREKGWVPLPRLVVYWILLLAGDLVFYVILTPVWIGLRVAAWIAEIRSWTRKETDATAGDRGGRRFPRRP